MDSMNWIALFAENVKIAIILFLDCRNAITERLELEEWR